MQAGRTIVGQVRRVGVRAARAIVEQVRRVGQVRQVGQVGKGIAIYFSIEFSSFFISVFLL